MERLFLIIFETLCLSLQLHGQHGYRMDYMWAHSFNTYYRVHDAATTWETARQICEAEGTSLLVPNSIEEIENLKLLISNMKAHYTAVYVGIHNQFSQGHFVTIKGVPIAFTLLDLLWSEGRPDNKNGSENCVVMSREGLFEDVNCNEIYPFLCKIKKNDIHYNKDCDMYDLDYKLEKNGKCYKFHDEPLPWYDAYRTCGSEQGHLAVINSDEEASLVTSFLGEHIISKAPDHNILFVGFSDLMYPFQYRTIFGQTLESAGYSSWSPLKADLVVSEELHCGAISRTGFLKVASCDLPAMFLCEKLMNNSKVVVDSKKRH